MRAFRLLVPKLIPLFPVSLIAFVSNLWGNPETQGFEVRAEKGAFVISEAGQTVLRYNREPVSRADGTYIRSHYIHPLFATDGTAMTVDMPEDHLHHRGVFWGWTQLWVDGERIGDPWHLKGMRRHVKEVAVEVEEAKAQLACEVLWHTDLLDTESGGRNLVKERALITVRSAAGGDRRVDFEIQLQALQEGVQIGGSMNEKGYGGFSVRIPMPKDLTFSGSDAEPLVNWKAPAAANRWVDFSASYAEGKRSGITVFTHPKNPGYPHGWTLRKENSCQNPVFPGEQPVALSMEEPLVLRYSLFLHDSDFDTEKVSSAYADYLNEVK